MRSDLWTFRVPGTDCLVLTPPGSEGLLLCNSTAAWIWQNRSLPHLEEAYAERYDLESAQAKSDLDLTLAAWASQIPSSSSLTLAICGTSFHISLESSVLSDELLPRLSHLSTPDTALPDHTFRLSQSHAGCHIEKDGRPFVTEPSVTGARSQLLQELTRLASPGRDFLAVLHAGACGSDKECIILAGASFAGKSTLCRSLMAQGLICYSDDSACLTADFQVAGMPFPLALRNRPRWLPSNLNGCSPTAQPRALVFVDYQPEAPGTALILLADCFETLLAIQACGFWVAHSEPAIAAFLEWLAQMPTYRLTYSDLPEATTLMQTLLNTPKTAQTC